MKRPSLLIQFSLISLVLLAVFGALLGWGLTRFFESQELDRQKETTAHLMLPAVAPFLTRDIMANGAYGNDYKAIERAFGYLGGAGLVRVKIWNDKGVVVYSDQQSLVGQKFAISDELGSALWGDVAGDISSLQKGENVDERGY